MVVVKAPKSPLKASLLSTFVPGAGQIYNQKYWKAPVVWGGFGLTYYFYSVAKLRYDFYHQMLIYKDQGTDDATVQTYLDANAAKVTGLSSETLLNSEQSFYQTRNDLYLSRINQVYIAGFVWYLVNIVDATVDAHFSSFDVSEDLSLNIQPTYLPNAWAGSGIALRLQF